MAKKTKDSNLSLEEKLEQALIPNWDEPYKLPDNWCWVNLGSLGTLGMGQTILSKDLKEEGVPVYSATEEDKIFGYISESENTIKLSSGDIVIPARGNSIGHVKYISCDEASCTQTTMFFKPFDKSIGKCVYYYMQGNKHKLFAYHGNAIPQITITNITKKEIPIPPLNEQHRIVARIESLFAKLDEAKEKAQEVVDGFETRKAAILHKAFSGELTQKWREENGISNNTWVIKTLRDVCKSIYDGDHMPPPKSENGIPFLVISNVNTGYLSFEDTRFVPKEYYDNITDTRKPQKGDVLYTLVGSYGIPVVVDTDNAFCFQRHMALLKPLSIDTYFLWYLLQTQEMYQKASAIAKGVAQLTVPIKGLRAMKFSCPSSEEQQEIVKLLDVLIKKEQGAKDTAEAVIEQIDTMKKAILARAFRGELGTKDVNDISAIELLKEMLSENTKDEKTKRKRTTIPKHLVELIQTNLERKIVMLFLKSENGEVSAEKIMSVSSKKFDILNTIRNLESKNLIYKQENDTYKLAR